MGLSDKTKKMLGMIGLLLLGLGLGSNAWLLGQASPWLERAAGLTIILSAENQVRIWIFDIVFILMGLTLILLKYRSNPRLRMWSDFSIGLFLMMATIILAEGVFYALNTYKPTDDLDHYLYYLGPKGERKELIKPDESFGFKHIPNNQIFVKEIKHQKILYDVTYTIDKYGHRIIPVEHPEDRIKFVLFFADSFAFGYGVNDNETLPFYVGQLAPHYRPYNYGVSAYGPQQMLATLESDEINQEVKESQGLLIYIFLNVHVSRAIGSMSIHNLRGPITPYYTLDSDNRMVRKGNLVSGRPVTSLVYSILGISQIVNYFGFDFPTINEHHLKITARIIEEAHHRFREKFKSDNFYVLIYPGEKTSLIPYFKSAGINYLDYSKLFDPGQKGLSIEGDGHPTAQAYKIIAEKVAKDLSLVEGQ